MPAKLVLFELLIQDIQSEFDTGLQAIKLDLPAKYFAGAKDSENLFAQPMKADFGAFLKL